MPSCAADTLRPAGTARREEAVTRSTAAAFEARIKAEEDARKPLLAEHQELTDDYNRRAGLPSAVRRRPPSPARPYR